MKLVINEFGEFLGVKRRRFTAGNRTIPCRDVDMIVLSTKGVSLSTDAIALAVKNRINLVIATYYGRPIAYVTPFKQATTYRRAQYSISKERETEIARAFLYGKMSNQYSLLKSANKYRLMPEIEAKAHRIRELSIALAGTQKNGLFGVEGGASREYWSAVSLMLPPEYGFTTREYPNAKDTTNALLNYGYGVLQSVCWLALINANLDPCCGILHSNEINRPSLVFDFMEEFRAQIVDRAVFRLLNTRQVDLKAKFDNELKKLLLEAIFKRLGTAASAESGAVLEDTIYSQAKRLALSIKDGVPYDPFILKW